MAGRRNEVVGRNIPVIYSTYQRAAPSTMFTRVMSSRGNSSSSSRRTWCSSQTETTLPRYRCVGQPVVNQPRHCCVEPTPWRPLPAPVRCTVTWGHLPRTTSHCRLPHHRHPTYTRPPTLALARSDRASNTSTRFQSSSTAVTSWTTRTLVLSTARHRSIASSTRKRLELSDGGPLALAAPVVSRLTLIIIIIVNNWFKKP